MNQTEFNQYLTQKAQLNANGTYLLAWFEEAGDFAHPKYTVGGVYYGQKALLDRFAQDDSLFDAIDEGEVEVISEKDCPDHYFVNVNGNYYAKLICQ